MINYKIAEIFTSINGEGTRAGQLAVFIRFCGCNLHCSYCDTWWANESDALFRYSTTQDIVSLVGELGIKNVTLTGGEPLIQEGIEELIDALGRMEGIRVEIETNGAVPLKPFAGMDRRPHFTMDYKLPGSKMEEFMCLENFDVLTMDDAVKFVIKDQADMFVVRDIIEKYDLTKKCRVLISPVFGEIEPEELVLFIKGNLLNDVTLQIQLHKIIWDENMRGV